ncbi:MAG: MurR/RpiR family transcriptional regulator [Synergistota bacterium]|nr:MurR/RpiR family transcriptional regulator [Synergistota bacterium]
MLKGLIASKLRQMTPGQRMVAGYIIENPYDAAFLTASQLGKMVGVSETTVIRLAHLLGFSGYHQLRGAMSGLLLDRLSTLERIREYGASQEQDYFERALHKDMGTIDMALSSVSFEDVKRLGEAIASAGAVYLAGYRSSYSLSYYLQFYLSWILPNVKSISPDMPFEMLLNSPRDGLVLGISFPRYSAWTVKVLETASKLGLTTASITDDMASPLAVRSKYTVAVPYRPVSFIDSFAAPMSVLNCLILSVAQRLGDDVTRKLSMLEKRWEEEEVYIQQKAPVKQEYRAGISNER